MLVTANNITKCHFSVKSNFSMTNVYQNTVYPNRIWLIFFIYHRSVLSNIRSYLTTPYLYSYNTILLTVEQCKMQGIGQLLDIYAQKGVMVGGCVHKRVLLCVCVSVCVCLIHYWQITALEKASLMPMVKNNLPLLSLHINTTYHSPQLCICILHEQHCNAGLPQNFHVRVYALGFTTALMNW